MKLLTSRYFWAFLFMALGVLLFIAEWLTFEIPFFRLVIAILLVGLGIELIDREKNPGQGQHNQPLKGLQNTVFLGLNEFTIDSDGLKREYTVLFGNQVLNFKHFTLKESRSVEVKTIFGECRIFIPKGVPYQIRASTFLGETKGPDGSTGSFGENQWRSHESEDASVPTLTILSTTVLGSLKITEL